ncbi:hypothetical protein GLOIN_2v1497539 [Rhizophagus clarus]|uniref:DUF7431 domain-containing protein n=1 Tax=Rhizophagus clarus TaxID=94130 RepID=A0A8H3L6U9_9GLOM|nr:hypothetical protein GLOIN_2v1497539 [Rhizophagus clarus]
MILYSEVVDLYYKYILNKSGESKIAIVGIPTNISDILLNKEAECNIFATVIDIEETINNLFNNCQILPPPDGILPQDGIPSLIIYCIQRNDKKT